MALARSLAPDMAAHASSSAPLLRALPLPLLALCAQLGAVAAAASASVLAAAVARGLLETEPWWRVGSTSFAVWDQSWMTPRVICGIRFYREPFNGVGQGLRTWTTEAGLEGPSIRDEQLQWVFDGTVFQQRALEFYAGRGAPPMNDVWMAILLSRIPESDASSVLSGGDLMELKCSGMILLASLLYAEYLALVVPASVLLKSCQHATEIHHRMGMDETAEELYGNIHGLKPIQTALASLHATLQVAAGSRALAAEYASLGALALPVVDVVVAHCREDLGWLREWLRQVLRDEWTPEVRGLRLRLLIYERCTAAPQPEASSSQERPPPTAVSPSAAELVAGLKRLGAIDMGSAAVELPEPPGFENVAYVHYCRNAAFRDAEFAIFLHGAPYDHMDIQTLHDVLRSLALGTYSVPFLHLNAKRLAQMELEPCVRDLLRPALFELGLGLGGADSASATAAAPGPLGRGELPTEMSTYCCSQFVVGRERLRAVPDAFWDEVWQQLESQGEVGDANASNVPTSCRASASRINGSHQRHGGTWAAEHGVWAVALERTWHWIFGESPLLPIRDVDPRLPLFLRVPRPRATGDGGPRGAVQEFVNAPDWGFDPGWWGADRALANVTQVPMVVSALPVPTSLFTAVARENWKLPSWAEAWFAEEPEEQSSEEPEASGQSYR